MKSVVSLPEYYESDTPEKLTKKLKSIEAFKAVKVPVKENGSFRIIDLENRMFVEDFPYGVVVYKDIAMLFNLKTPTIDLLLDFYKNISGIKYDFINKKESLSQTGAPTVNGLKTIEEFIKFYKRGK